LLTLFILILSLFLLLSDKGDELGSFEQKETELRASFEKEQSRAVNLQPLKQQLAQMEQVLQQLPSKSEMPDLIIDISQTALSSGLANELFQPGPESSKELYAEKPIALRMVCSYHQFGAFVSGVASLPRVVILTMHDINLKPRDKKVGITARGELELSGTAKTYRYLDDKEMADQEKAAAAAKKGSKQGGGA